MYVHGTYIQLKVQLNTKNIALIAYLIYNVLRTQCVCAEMAEWQTRWT